MRSTHRDVSLLFASLLERMGLKSPLSPIVSMSHSLEILVIGRKSKMLLMLQPIEFLISMPAQTTFFLS